MTKKEEEQIKCPRGCGRTIYKSEKCMYENDKSKDNTVKDKKGNIYNYGG